MLLKSLGWPLQSYQGLNCGYPCSVLAHGKASKQWSWNLGCLYYQAIFCYYHCPQFTDGETKPRHPEIEWLAQDHKRQRQVFLIPKPEVQAPHSVAFPSHLIHCFLYENQSSLKPSLTDSFFFLLVQLGNRLFYFLGLKSLVYLLIWTLKALEVYPTSHPSFPQCREPMPSSISLFPLLSHRRARLLSPSGFHSVAFISSAGFSWIAALCWQSLVKSWRTESTFSAWLKATPSGQPPVLPLLLCLPSQLPQTLGALWSFIMESLRLKSEWTLWWQRSQTNNPESIVAA